MTTLADRCPSCRTKLPASGRCPGLDSLIERNGRRWGIAAQIAHALGGDIAAATVRRWAYRSRQPGDKLSGMLPGHHLPGRGRGETWYALDQAAHVERTTRLTAEHHGGQPRLGRVELTAAA